MIERPVSDAAARREALDISRSFIVQAPAGSGKTELLIQRYLRLLARVDRPEEILAITFTRKAAAEMRTRILDALKLAADGTEPESEHQRLTWQAAREALLRDAEEGWDLADFPERMQIQTLDAFSARITAALPITSGLGGRIEMVGEGADAAIYREAARATLDWAAETGDIGEAVRTLFLHLDNDVSAWERALAEMLRRRDQWLPITGAGPKGQEERLRHHFEESLAMLIEDQLRSLDGAIPAASREPLLGIARFAAGNLSEASDESPICALRDRNAWPAPTAASLAIWQGLAQLLVTGTGHWRKRVDKRQGFPPGTDTEKEQLYALIDALSAEAGLATLLQASLRLPHAKYGEDQWEVLLALLMVLPRATAELKTRFATRGLADYVEVALAARAALGVPEEPTDLALALDYRIQHLLVDEMQDTSLGQYALLESLTAGWDGHDGRTIFCVGDPMQSIYRFRQAEVGLFLALRAKGIGQLRPSELRLETNFRSGGNLVGWANEAFARIMPQRDDLTVGCIRHSPSSPAPGREGQGHCLVHALLDAGPQAEAETVLKLLTEALLDPESGELAVLVRSRTHLRDLLPRLRAAGIPYRAVEIDRLTDLPEIQDLLALTRALIHPLDRIAWLALLRAPWCGITLAGLHALVMNDADTPVLDLMQDEDRLQRLMPEERERVNWLRLRMTSALAYPGQGSLRERVECLWFSLGGPATLASAEETDSVYRFLDILETLERGATLPDVATLETQLDEERVSSPGGEGCRLSVLTIHKAKGLEFDTVILTGLGRRPRASERTILNWLTLPDINGHEHLLPSPIGARHSRDKDLLHEFIHAIEQQKQRLELDRLLYVACTRARTSLHLVGNAQAREDGVATPSDTTLLARLWPAVKGHYEEALAEHGKVDEDDSAGTGARQQEPRVRRFRDVFVPGTLPPSVDAPSFGLVAAAGDTAIEYEWVGRDLRHVGTVVHAWLQRMATWSDADTARRRLPGLRERHATLLRARGVSEESLTAAVDRVEAALSATLEDPIGCWILFGKHDSASTELAIEGIVARRLVTVVLDRCVIDANGRHWIIDYKTSRHEGGELERFLSEEARRYAQQMANYRRLYQAVHGTEPFTGLYFPLHARLVPMDAGAAEALTNGLPG